MKVLVYTIWPIPSWEVPKSHVRRLSEEFPHLTFSHALSDEEAFDQIQTAEIALAPRMTPALLQHAPRLKWVHSTAASVGILPLKELDRRGIIVTNSRGIQAVPMAEYVIGGLLILTRRFNKTLAAQRDRQWIQNDLSGEEVPWTLHRRTMTIFGLGTIGQEVARRAHAFGMTVRAVRRRVQLPKPAFVDEVVGPDRLHDALRGSDVLVISAPFLPETNQLIGDQELALLNRGGIVVNVGRGKIMKEHALVEALKNGHLGGAVLDVFEHEPLNPDSPLWALPNVVITPHCSGFRPGHWDDVIDLFSENLRRFQKSEPLLNLVDCRAGY